MADSRKKKLPTAGFIQNIPRFGDIPGNLARVEKILGDKTPDLLVLPELFATGYQFRDKREAQKLAETVPGGPTTDFIVRLARERGIYIVAGLAERAASGVYNSAAIAGPRGYIATYRKAHIFDTERNIFLPGNLPFAVYEAGKKFRFGVMICFDWRFPETARTLALRGADIIAHPSNLVLPHCPQAMITRCLENRVYAVTADRAGADQRFKPPLKFIGQSQIAAPDGKILIRASVAREEYGSATFDPAIARNKKINSRNDLFTDRRTDLYQK